MSIIKYKFRPIFRPCFLMTYVGNMNWSHELVYIILYPISEVDNYFKNRIDPIAIITINGGQVVPN
jgi:hypothetical protein